MPYPQCQMQQDEEFVEHVQHVLFHIPFCHEHKFIPSFSFGGGAAGARVLAHIHAHKMYKYFSCACFFSTYVMADSAFKGLYPRVHPDKTAFTILRTRRSNNFNQQDWRQSISLLKHFAFSETQVDPIAASTHTSPHRLC